MGAQEPVPCNTGINAGVSQPECIYTHSHSYGHFTDTVYPRCLSLDWSRELFNSLREHSDFTQTREAEAVMNPPRRGAPVLVCARKTWTFQFPSWQVVFLAITSSIQVAAVCSNPYPAKFSLIFMSKTPESCSLREILWGVSEFPYSYIRSSVYCCHILWKTWRILSDILSKCCPNISWSEKLYSKVKK